MPKLPVVGNVSTGTLVAGGAAAVVIGGYIWWNHSKNAAASAAASTPNTGANNQTGNYGYGYAYGLGAGEVPYTQDGYGYGFGYGYGGYGYSGFGSQGYPYGVGSEYPTSAAATTNAEWSQAALAALTANGYSGARVLVGLGRYLRGQTVNNDQLRVINAAIAIEGYPPVAGTNDYPPNIHTTGNQGQGGGTSPVPNVVGMDWEAARTALINAGFKARHVPSKPGKVVSQSPRAGNEAKQGATVTCHIQARTTSTTKK